MGPQAVPKGKVPPPLIRIADFKAVAAMSGRRPKEHCRSIELSVWLPEGGPLGLQALHHLASRASSTLWKPKLPSADATDKGGVGGGAATAAAAVAGGGAEAEFWCAPTAAEARATSAVRRRARRGRGDLHGSSAEVATERLWRGLWHGFGAAAAAAGRPRAPPPRGCAGPARSLLGGRRWRWRQRRRRWRPTCAPTASRSPLGREVTRGEAALWQARSARPCNAASRGGWRFRVALVWVFNTTAPD